MYPKEDARMQFMRILRTLPYGNATFFSVRRIGECALLCDNTWVGQAGTPAP
jgi:hypothetical protein